MRLYLLPSRSAGRLGHRQGQGPDPRGLLSVSCTLLTPPRPQGTKEARRASGTEDPSFNSCAGSSTSIHSFTDDLGYQGSRELSSVSAASPASRLPWEPTARAPCPAMACGHLPDLPRILPAHILTKRGSNYCLQSKRPTVIESTAYICLSG